jgi:hypothetical protein
MAATIIYSGVNSVVKAVATGGTPAAITDFRSLEINESADAETKPDSSTSGWGASIAGNKFHDETLAIFIPYGGNLVGGISGSLSLAGNQVAHVRKITLNYTHDNAKQVGSSDTAGWKVAVPGTNSYKVSVDCYAPAAVFGVGTIKSGDTVAIVIKATSSDAGLSGNIVVDKIGGFKAGVEGGGAIGFTLEGRGHLSIGFPTITPFVLGSLFDFQVFAIGGSSPEITFTSMVVGINDFTIDIEGATIIGPTIKLLGHGELNRAAA